MNKIDHKLAGALACLCLSGPLAAQGGKSLGEVSVLATPIVEANHIGDFSGFSTTVSAEQIRDLGALDLAAALRMTPGVQISRYNEVGSYSGDQGGNVYIRGLGGSRPGSEIKTYIDGLPVYMGVWNHPLIDLLPLNGMQRVSVQKGPDGMQNGNNFAAVNLETRRAREDGIQGEIQASVGTMATRVVQTSVVGRQQGLDFMLAAGHVHSNGDRQNSDGELNNAIGRLNLQLNAQWSAQLGFLSVGNRVGDPGDNRYPVSSTPVGPYSFSNGVARNQSQTTMLHAGLSHRHGDWQGELKIFENRGENNLLNDASWGTFDSSFVMSGLRWKESWSPWRGGRLTAGLDWDRVSGKVSGPHVGSPVGTPFGFGVAGTADVPEFRLLSPYVGLSQQFDLSRDWVLQPSLGLRYYESNIYPARTAPQAGVSLISEALTLYANHVHGLLYPGAETYTLTRAIPMAFAANNGWDRLSPSEDKHSEIGAKWQLAATTRLDFSVFEDRVSQRYIWSGFASGAFAPPASGTWSNAFPDYRTQGAELALQHQLSRDWQLFAGATALKSSLENLPYAPRTALSLGVNGQWSGYKLSLDAQHQSGMYALTQDRGSFSPNRVEGFTVANLKIARPLTALGKHGEVFALINNLFDADYQYNAGYPMPGRTFRVGVVAGF